MRILTTLLALLCSIGMMAQGINFETGSWNDVVEKAKKENKLIYLDVYAEWCGPCKMMARDVFPNEKAGKKYNELFINYKVDAEKGEGREVARRYGVSSYPTNLYINPHTLKPVFRIPGACGVEEFLKRADIAQHDFSDPMTWAEYKARLKSDPADLEFLQLYISKAQRLGEYYDDAIDIYVSHHMSVPVHDSQLAFLLTHVQNMDNKGYTVLTEHRDRADRLVQDPRYKLEEREKNVLLNNTFKKAVELQNLTVMASAKPILYKYNAHDSLGKWYNIENHYYRTVKDEKKLYQNHLNTIAYYEKLTESEIRERNEKSFQENIDLLKKNPRLARQNEEGIQKEINNQVKRNIAFKYPLTVNRMNSYLSASEHILQNAKVSKKQLRTAMKWLETAESIIPEENIELTDKIYDLKAKYHYISKNTSEAIDITNKRIEFLKNKKVPSKNAEELLAKIQAGTLMEGK